MNLKNFWFHAEASAKQIDPLIVRRILAYHESLMIVEVDFQKGGVGSLHGHPHEQITYVLSGTFEFTINGVSKVVRAGDSMFMEKDVIHGTVCLESGKLLDIFTPHREDFIEGN
ncbi:MAG: cupin domain-containing protein [Bacillus subtilis]|nr:cupin domain-containing protein [Bacillus subtilis]